MDYLIQRTEGTKIPAPQGASTEPSGEVRGQEEEGRGLLSGRNTCVRALIALFLKHYHNAEGATIEVCVCVCVCVRVCVRACVRACVCVHVRSA